MLFLKSYIIISNSAISSLTKIYFREVYENMGSDTDGRLTVDLENLEDILLELEYCNTNTSYSIFCNLYESEYLLFT